MNNILELLDVVIRDSFKGIKGYFKSRLIILGIVFVILSVGFVIIKAPMPLLIAFLIALLDIVPLLGAGLVMIPWGIISYFWGSQELGIGVFVLYFVLTILKQFIEPKVLGEQIGIRPLYTFIATVLGSLVFGPIGLILGPIIAIIINSIYRFRQNT
ncbi:AI-2E family transporter [Tissierella sp. Yu-01]|uniref:AI-2E family transporter n=1 Tax=Tissierella sp. Yu-01 TaxID=3035694 RepID=UPI00240E88E3|nr:AI-2E family transporter [Tissierella sp. Yu-01]WFA07872.1 AI-2E family transporter [Tissierella sp. Yu-01]